MTILDSQWGKQYGAWAVVTGASDGIGYEIAQELAAAGLNLVLVARREQKLQALADTLSAQYSIQAKVIAADLSDKVAVQRVIDETASLDVGLLVAAAGYGTTGDFIDVPIEQELNMLAVNCNAVVVMAHAFGKRFAQKGRGGIVLFSSLVAFQGVPRSANYAASKAYMQSFAEALRVELKPHGVDVLASAPGPVASGFAERADMQMGASVTARTVAKETLAALGKRTTVRPGFLSKFLEFSLSLMPRWGRVWAMGKIMGV